MGRIEPEVGLGLRGREPCPRGMVVVRCTCDPSLFVMSLGIKVIIMSSRAESSRVESDGGSDFIAYRSESAPLHAHRPRHGADLEIVLATSALHRNAPPRPTVMARHSRILRAGLALGQTIRPRMPQPQPVFVVGKALVASLVLAGVAVQAGVLVEWDGPGEVRAADDVAAAAAVVAPEEGGELAAADAAVEAGVVGLF